jgi:hypothetical protein
MSIPEVPMENGSVGGFRTELWRCAQVGTAHEAVAAVRSVGGEFISWRGTGYQLGLEPIVRPAPSGSFGGPTRADFHHPALRMDLLSQLVIRSQGLPTDTPPWAYLSYSHEAHVVSVGQDAGLEDQRLVDQLALGQLRLACDLCPRTEPVYGWIDERGHNAPSWGAEGPTPHDLRFIFWANVFGPKYAEFLGRDFLHNAPGWQLVDLPGGGFLYVVTESYLDWRNNDRGDVLAHFQQRVPNIQLYRAEDWGY